MKTSMSITKYEEPAEYPVYCDGDVLISSDNTIYICRVLSTSKHPTVSAVRIMKVTDGTIRASECNILKNHVKPFFGKITIEITE